MSTSVSVVATVRNEQASVAALLEALLAQTRHPDEIVIADGGSTDGTREAIRDFACERTARVRLIDAPGSRIAQGRNIAIDQASGPIIAVTDGGVMPRSDWLERLVLPLEEDPGVAVSSGFFLPGGSTWFERFLATVITPQLPEVDPETFLPSSRSVAFRKEWWKRVGGYPEWLLHGEDRVFDLALKRAGARFAFSHEAVVMWSARPTVRRFARQYFNYARADAHAGLFPARQAARYGSYGAGLIILAAARRRPVLLAPLIAGGLAYMSRYWRRLRRIPPFSGAIGRAAAYAFAPVIVATGDVAKMVGYAVGRFGRDSPTDQVGRRGESDW